MNFTLIKSTLEKADVKFDKGLTDSEAARIESIYDFQFPPDLREFLQFSLPIGEGWVDWRSGSEKEIVSGLNWAYEGICFDIEFNNFWLENWGEKPEELSDCFDTVKIYLQKMPKLIPILSHRFIPDKPNLKDNPVFSVYQTDTIIYGNNLENYFQNEFAYYFGHKENFPSVKECRYIEFWTDLTGEDL